jgi:spermidine synthase
MTNPQKFKLLPQLVIFLAGFTFLIFEISWNRILGLYLGSTVFASTLVLSTFMAGIGFGGMFWGSFVSKNPNKRNLLAFILSGIAIVGLINYLVFQNLLPGIYEVFSGASMFIRELIVYLVAFVFLMVATFFMGGVLPILTKTIIHSDEKLGSNLGRIYGLETLGSAIGGLLTGFFLLGNLGQQNTVFLSVLIMLVLAAMVWRLMPLQGSNVGEEAERNSKSNKVKGKSIDMTKPALLLTFICGFTIVGMQVVWIRILKTYLTNTSYTFALIASLVILGLFVGSWYYKMKSKQFRNPLRLIFRLLFAMALLIVFGLVLMLNLPDVMLVPLNTLFDTHFTRLLIIPAFISLIVIIPVAAISGYAFPLAIDLYTKSYLNVGKNVGRIMWVNALGSFLGPIAVAFLFIPLAGAGRSMLIIFIVLMLVSFFVARNMNKSQRQISSIISVFMGLIAFFAILSGWKMHILPPSFHVENKKVVEYMETVQGTIVVGEASNEKFSVKSTYVNNASVIGSSYDAIKAVKMVGHMPFFAGLECKKALIVGFGIGVTTSAIAAHDEIERIDCVEIVPGLQKAATYYSELNKNVLRDPRLNIYGGDGRHFLQSATEKYDFISSDPTHPVLGSGNLYTQEYFELYKKHLTDNGMVTQYLPLHKLNKNDLLGLIKTFHSVFPNTVVWLGHYHAVLMGSMNPIELDFKDWEKRIEKLPKDIYFYTNPYHLAASLIYDSKAIEDFDKEIKINTDNRSYVEFFDFSVFEEENLPANLSYLNFSRDGVWRVFKNVPDQMMLKRFLEGNKIMTRGLEGMLRNDPKLLFSQLQKAIRINPENEELPFLIKLYSR